MLGLYQHAELVMERAAVNVVWDLLYVTEEYPNHSRLHFQYALQTMI
jgi:hypothetical protein